MGYMSTGAQHHFPKNHDHPYLKNSSNILKTDNS